MELYLVLFLGLISRFSGTAGQQKSYIAESANVFTTAFLKYNMHFRPYNESSNPLLINVRLDVVKILDVNIEDSRMTSIVDIRKQWVDGRLYWYSDLIKYVTVNSSEVWTPDVYFLNMESQPETLINPRFLTIESTGRVDWFQRIKLLTPCSSEPDTPGNLTCPVTFGSMQFPSSELDLNNIECDYNSENNKRFNVTSVYKEEVMEDLPGAPFDIRTIKRGSCVVNLFIDMEARKKEQEASYKYSAQRSSMNSSSVNVIASVFLTMMLSLTSMLRI